MIALTNAWIDWVYAIGGTVGIVLILTLGPRAARHPYRDDDPPR